MKWTLLVLPGLLCLSACATGPEEKDLIDNERCFNFKEIGHGLYSTNRVRSVPNASSPTGFSTISDDIKLLKSCDTIDARLGSEFGIEYEVETPDNKSVPLNIVWVFPDTMTNNEGKKFTRLDKTRFVDVNTNLSTTYELEAPFEVLKGRWMLKIYYNKNLVYRKKFWVR